MFICGSGSFAHHQDDDDDLYNSSSSPCPTPKRSKRSSSFCKIMGRTNSDDKNPYAKRGLDKFYALLAEHDDKKQKIYKEMGSEDISFVRFVYPHDSDGPKPIIVKVNHKDDKKQSSSHEMMMMMMSKVEAEEGKNPSKDSEKGLNEKNGELVKKKRRSVSSYVESLKKPYFYLPFLVVLILVFLAIYGRSFAILCTSIGWYMVPTISSSPATPTAERKLKSKKEYARKKSEKHMSPGPSSPRSVIDGLSSSELRRR